MQSRIADLSNHVVICGYGRMGQMVARDLAAGRVPLVILEHSPDRLADAEDAGHLCMLGDATDEQQLIAAGIERVRVLATGLPDDAANVFLTLSARSLNPRVEIIARGELATTERKLRHAGADRVILPAYAGAKRIAHMILYPTGDQLKADAELGRLAREFDTLGLVMERITVARDCAVAGLTIDAAEQRSNGSLFILQLEREAEPAVQRPPPHRVLEPGDSVLVLARGASAPHTLFAPRAPVATV